MEIRGANVTIASDPSDVSQAFVAHLSTTITSHVVTDPDYDDPWIAEIELFIDDERRWFTVAHAVTSNSRFSGMVVTCGVPNDNEHLNSMDMVLICFNKDGVEVVQRVYSSGEEYWLQHRAEILTELAGYVFK